VERVSASAGKRPPDVLSVPSHGTGRGFSELRLGAGFDRVPTESDAR